MATVWDGGRPRIRCSLHIVVSADLLFNLFIYFDIQKCCTEAYSADVVIVFCRRKRDPTYQMPIFNSRQFAPFPDIDNTYDDANCHPPSSTTSCWTSSHTLLTYWRLTSVADLQILSAPLPCRNPYVGMSIPPPSRSSVTPINAWVLFSR